MRTGLIAQKLGMSRLFSDDGTHVPVSVLHVDGCQVVAQRTTEKEGYTALQLGIGKVIRRESVAGSLGMFGRGAAVAVRPSAGKRNRVGGSSQRHD